MKQPGRKKKYVIIILIFMFFALGLCLWLFRPLSPSAYQTELARNAYLTCIFRTSLLTAPPFVTILPGLGYSGPPLPSWLDFVFPPIFSAFLYPEASGDGKTWVLFANLGWRSRIYHGLSHFLQDRVEDSIYFLQDQGTLFLTTNRYLLEDLAADRVTSNLNPPGDDFRRMPENTLLAMDIYNENGEITRWVEKVQRDSQFLIFPSIGEIQSLHFVLRKKEGSKSIGGEIVLRLKNSGTSENVRTDAEYLLDLLDRIMTTGEVAMEKKIAAEKNGIRIDLTLLHPEGLAKVPWKKFREGL